MITMDKFTSEQHTLLVALPYRVGVWVSSSDSSGGDDADEAEMQALRTIVMGFGEDFLKSEFVQRLMEETIKHSGEWENWENDLDKVPDECSQAVYILKDFLDRKELLSFKLTLIEIATAVAMAYREEGNAGDLVFDLRVKALLFVDKLKLMMGSKKRPVTPEELINISATERLALHQLTNALGLDGPAS